MPIKYIPFIPEPVEGQAVLGNFNRILRYKGADELSMTLQRGMPLYEMEKQETVGENTDGNMVIRGECVSACAYLKEQGLQVDLVYIDPPFASGADYAKKVYIRRNPKVAEAIAQAERELDVDELKAFEEKMYGDVWDKEKYLSWMYENLMAIKGVMSETASIYVHLSAIITTTKPLTKSTSCCGSRSCGSSEAGQSRGKHGDTAVLFSALSVDQAHRAGKEKAHEHPQAHRLHYHVCRAGRAYGGAAPADGIVLRDRSSGQRQDRERSGCRGVGIPASGLSRSRWLLSPQCAPDARVLRGLRGIP